MSIKFEIIESYKDKGINLPKRGTDGSAGYDFEAAEEVVVKPLNSIMKYTELSLSANYNINLSDDIPGIKKVVTMVPTGIKAKMPKNVVLEINVRSSIGTKKLLILPNQTGIIDSDYYNNPNNEGHIYIPLINLSSNDIIIKKGDKIAQGIFLNYLVTDDDSNIEKSERTGGFGSTNKKENEFKTIAVLEELSKK